MINIKKARKFSCPFAICIILSFALVLGCDFLCDLGIVSFQAPQPSLVAESSVHSHQHGDEHPTSTHRDNHKAPDLGSAEHHHESSNEEGCCNDLTQQFYSSLVNTAGTQVGLIQLEVYKLISILTFVDLNQISLKRNLLVLSKFEHPPNGPPGITGHGIRVLFCSILI